MITSSDESQVRNYAESCSWRAGKTLASAMEHNEFSDWERVIVAVDNEKICGYCIRKKRRLQENFATRKQNSEKFGLNLKI